MFKTKEIFLSKRKMRNIFTAKKPRMLQKFLAVGVSFSLAAAMVPLGSRNFVAEAAEPEVTIPIEMFATPADLLKLSEETNGGSGLLATGSDSDKVIKINFGARDNEVKYYGDNWVHESAAAGNITWLIAGAEDSNSDSSADSLVLYSEKPIMSSKALDGSVDSRFQTSFDEQSYSSPPSSGYGDAASTVTVAATHWGASNLRSQLTALQDSLFAANEKPLLNESILETYDTKNRRTYSTEDVLYAPQRPNGSLGSTLTVGRSDDILLDIVYCVAASWLRSPYDDGYDTDVYAFGPDLGIVPRDVEDPSSTVHAAFELDLTSVLFSSSASVQSSAGSGGGFARIWADSPMTLRMDGTDSGAPLETAVIQAEGTTLTYTAPATSRLMAIVTTDDGATYQYVEEIDTAANGATFDFGSITELSGKSFAAQAWIETDMTDGGTLTYATEPVALARTVEKVDDPEDPVQPEYPEEPEVVAPDEDDITATPPLSELPSNSPVYENIETNRLSTTVNGLNIFVEDPNSALQDGVYLDVQLIEPGSDRWTELSAHYDGTHEVENVSFFEITLRYIKDDSPVEMPLSSPIRVLMQIPDGWDKSDMEAVLIASGADRQFEEDIVTKDGIDYVAFWSDHFSPYALIDKLSASEKSANQTSPKTGDDVTYLTISSLGLIMTLALGLMLKTNFGKRKFDE